MTAPEASVDVLVADLLARSPYRFTIAGTPAERATALGLRRDAVAAQGWASARDANAAGAAADVDDVDDFDDRAILVLGWEESTAMATGRVVLPPGPLPTEVACALVIEPAGQVADVGRMVVVTSHQQPRHGSFVALMCALYLEVRARGFEVACGMMAPNVRALMRHLGVQIEVLGPDRVYRGALRAPVRFELAASAAPLVERWRPA